VTAGGTTRAERMAMPLARQVVKDLAAEHGACLRPVQLRRTEIDTGHVEQVLIPCGHTLASVCPSCAERARILRAAQCREGWHLDHEPVIDPDAATQEQRALVSDRAEAQEGRDLLAGATRTFTTTVPPASCNGPLTVQLRTENLEVKRQVALTPQMCG